MISIFLYNIHIYIRKIKILRVIQFFSILYLENELIYIFRYIIFRIQILYYIFKNNLLFKKIKIINFHDNQKKHIIFNLSIFY